METIESLGVEAGKKILSFINQSFAESYQINDERSK